MYGDLIRAWTCCGAVATLTVFAAACSVPPPVVPPNIVLISIDTLNRSALRAFDPSARELPTFDRFAAGSARLVDAHSTGSWTLPSHASLMTGLYPDRHGAVDSRRKLGADTPTLAAMLGAAGYETVGFGDGGYVDAQYGFSAGFDRYDDWSRGGSRLSTMELPRDGRGAGRAGRGRSLFRRGLAYLDNREAGDPSFLLFLQTYVVHDYFRLHDWAMDELQHPEAEDSDYYLDCLRGAAACPEADWELLADLYDAELPNLDRGLARLLDALSEVEGDTYVIFLSDHGEGFDPSRGRIHHGGRLHEDQVRIPLLVAGPDIVARDIEFPVSLVDLVPTVLEIARVRSESLPDDWFDGTSIAAQLRGAGASSEDYARSLYAMEHHYVWQDGVRRASDESQQEPYSLALIRGPSWDIRTPTGEEVYDVLSDPLQRNNLAGELSLGDLREIVDGRGHALGGEEASVGPEVERQLRSLGYIQ